MFFSKFFHSTFSHFSHINIGFGDNGHNRIDGTDGKDLLFGLKGDDIIKAGDGNDVVFGGKGDDNLSGGKGDDWLFGGKGDDNLNGNQGNDFLFGGKGDDILDGRQGVNYVNGGAGNDRIEAGEGTNHISFGRNSGHDLVYEFGTDDRIVMSHFDRADFSVGTDRIVISLNDNDRLVLFTTFDPTGMTSEQFEDTFVTGGSHHHGFGC